jgi:prolyl-tRNA synthetase
VDLLLAQIQHDMLARATKIRDDHIITVMEYKDFVPALEKMCLCLTPWCNEEQAEEDVKKRSRDDALAAAGEAEEDAATATSAAAKTLCIPFDQVGEGGGFV